MGYESPASEDRLGEPQPEDRDEALESLERLRNVDALGWQTALAHRDALERFDAISIAPSAAQLDDLVDGAFAQFLPAVPIGEFEVAQIGDPEGVNTFGLVGSSVQLTGDKLMAGTLAVRFDPARLGAVARETLRLFKVVGPGELDLIPLSGVDVAGGFVWGFVNTPGDYALLGLNVDPLTLSTILTLDAHDAWLHALPIPRQRDFLDKVCGLILCSPDVEFGPDVRERLLHRQREAGFAVPPEGWIAGSDPCERCLGTRVPWHSLPERHLFGRPFGGAGGFFELPAGRCQHRWESVGPANMAGCMLDVAVDPDDPKVLYVASADGGLWRLDANPLFTAYSWTPLLDDVDNLSIVAVAVSQAAHSVVFIADTWNRVLRSTNGGKTWSVMATVGYVYRLLGHPADPDKVYAATSTGLWLIDRTAPPSSLLTGDVTDVAYDSAQPSVIYAAVRNVGVNRRDASGAWSTVFSLQAAAQLSVGSYVGLMIKLAIGRQGTTASRRIAVKFGPRNLDPAGNPTGTPSQPGPAFSEVFVNSASGLGTWRRCVTPSALGNSSQLDWVNVIAVDPADDDVMLVGGERLARTADGGQSWTTVMRYYYEVSTSNNHEDQHGVAFDRNQPGVCYVANDGGIYRSINSGASWSGINSGLVTTQPFNFGIADGAVLADVYHWGVLGSTAIGTKQFGQVEGGSWELTPVRGNPNQQHVFYYLRGQVTRRQFPGTGGTNDYTVYTPFPISWGLAFHPSPTSQLAFAGRWINQSQTSDIWRTTQSNQFTPAWTQDAITGINLTAPIVAIRFSTSDPATAYAMSSAGDVLRTTRSSNSTQPWTFQGRWAADVRSMAVNQFDPNRLYAIDAWRVARSIDAGVTWTVANGVANNTLPPGELTTIISSARSAGDLFVATSVGVVYSPDEGYHWYPIHDGLPNARVTEIAWSDDYLYVALRGRGFWRAQPYT
jgi:hypothetical protein